MNSPVLKSTVESAIRAALIAAATWAGVEFGADAIGTAASVIAVLVIAVVSILWSKFTHERNVLTDPITIKKDDQPPFGGPAAGMIIIAIMAGVGMIGCQNVGPENTITRDNTTLRNGSPVTLQIEDNDKKGIASGVGPARFTSITQDEVQTMQTGTTPRDLFLAKLPDGTIRFNLSSGTDIQAEGVTFDAAMGSFRVDRFGTSASEPLRAGNEAYDRLIIYWASLTEAQKQARLAEIEALKLTAPELADLILGIVTGI